MINKKGQSSTITVTIAIVLGIALIVFLIWGFSTNWKMFTSTSGAYSGSDVATAKDACRYQCEAGLKSAYCDNSKTEDDLNCADPQLLGPGECGDVTCTLSPTAAGIKAVADKVVADKVAADKAAADVAAAAIP